MMSIILRVFVGIVLVSGVLTRNIDSSVQNCEAETIELLNQLDTCAPKNIGIFDIISVIQQFTDQNINSTVYSQHLNEYCATVTVVCNCSLEIINNSRPACRSISSTQRFVNIFRMATRLGTDLCFEQNFYNIASDAGFKCLLDSEIGNCWLESTKINGGYSFDDNHICASLKRLFTCWDSFFHQCKHDGQIKNYFDQTRISWNDEFSCNV